MPRSPSSSLLALALACAAVPAGAKEVWLRETHFIVYRVDAGEGVAFTMTPRARGTADPQPMQWRVYDADGALVAEGRPAHGQITVRYTSGEAGINVARLTGNRNWYELAPAEGSTTIAEDRYGIVTSEFAHLHTCGDERPVYFYVPRGAKRVRAFVLADSPKEGATFRILDPEGHVAAEIADQFDRPTKVDARVGEGQDGRVWWFRLAPAEGMPFDDVVVWFGGSSRVASPIPPLTSFNAEALMDLLRAIPGALPEGE